MSQKCEKSPKCGGVGGGVSAEDKKSIIQNAYYYEMGGRSWFSYFSQIQMTEIWPWLRW